MYVFWILKIKFEISEKLTCGRELFSPPPPLAPPAEDDEAEIFEMSTEEEAAGGPAVAGVEVLLTIGVAKAGVAGGG